MFEKLWHEQRPFLLTVIAAGFILFWGQSTITSQLAKAREQNDKNERRETALRDRQARAEEQGYLLEHDWNQLGEEENPAVDKVQLLLFKRRDRFLTPTEDQIFQYGRERAQLFSEARDLAKKYGVDPELPEGLGLAEDVKNSEAHEAFTRLDLTDRVVTQAIEAGVSRVLGIDQIRFKYRRGSRPTFRETPVSVTVEGKLSALRQWLTSFSRPASFLEVRAAALSVDEESGLLRCEATLVALQERGQPSAIADEAEATDSDEGLDLLPFDGGF